jgi:hypothetical protein
VRRRDRRPGHPLGQRRMRGGGSAGKRREICELRRRTLRLLGFGQVLVIGSGMGPTTPGRHAAFPVPRLRWRATPFVSCCGSRRK